MERFTIIDDPILDTYAIYDNEKNIKYDATLVALDGLVEFLNKQDMKIKNLEVEIEDLNEIKEKFRKESKDYLELYLKNKHNKIGGLE
jgi:hypothetical protein